MHTTNKTKNLRRQQTTSTLLLKNENQHLCCSQPWNIVVAFFQVRVFVCTDGGVSLAILITIPYGWCAQSIRDDDPFVFFLAVTLLFGSFKSLHAHACTPLPWPKCLIFHVATSWQKHNHNQRAFSISFDSLKCTIFFSSKNGLAKLCPRLFLINSWIHERGIFICFFTYWPLVRHYADHWMRIEPESCSYPECLREKKQSKGERKGRWRHWTCTTF